MPVIKTTRNRVIADCPEPNDTHVQVTWFGPSQDGVHRKVFHGPLLPVEDYDEAVAWATGIADQMAHTLYVVPLTGAETLRAEQMQLGVTNLDHQQRGEMRRLVVATMAEVMRDSDDPDVRSGAYDVLVKTGVVR